jgi:hypothetical protein
MKQATHARNHSVGAANVKPLVTEASHMGDSASISTLLLFKMCEGMCTGIVSRCIHTSPPWAVHLVPSLEQVMKMEWCVMEINEISGSPSGLLCQERDRVVESGQLLYFKGKRVERSCREQAEEMHYACDLVTAVISPLNCKKRCFHSIFLKSVE